MIKVYYKCIKHGLKLTELYKTLECDKSHVLGDILEKNWDVEVERSKAKNQVPSLLKVLFDTFFWRSMAVGMLTFVQYVVLQWVIYL